MKTDNSQLETNKRYRQTKKGVIRNIFAHIKERCQKLNRDLEFNSEQLLDWMQNQPEFHSIYNEWVSSGFKKAFRPSIDRIDPLLGYFFSNIQVTTYQFNRDKGDVEKEILWGKPILQFDLEGNFLNRFPSIKSAVIALGLNQGLVSAVLLGQRNHTGGFKFIYETPELLKHNA